MLQPILHLRGLYFHPLFLEDENSSYSIFGRIETKNVFWRMGTEGMETKRCLFVGHKGVLDDWSEMPQGL